MYYSLNQEFIFLSCQLIINSHKTSGRMCVYFYGTWFLFLVYSFCITTWFHMHPKHIFIASAFRVGFFLPHTCRPSTIPVRYNAPHLHGLPTVLHDVFQTVVEYSWIIRMDTLDWVGVTVHWFQTHFVYLSNQGFISASLVYLSPCKICVMKDRY